MDKKRCSVNKGCGLEKDVGEFSKKGNGYNNICKECKRIYNKQYHLDNQEKMKEKSKQYYQNNSEKILKNKKQYRIHNPEKIKEKSKRYYQNNIEKLKQYRQNNPEKIMLAGSISRAKKKNLEHNITLEDILIPECCPVLGIKLEVCEEGQAHSSPSLDRIDNSKGYVKGNIRVISWRANNLKSDATVEELEKVLRYMKSGK